MTTAADPPTVAVAEVDEELRRSATRRLRDEPESFQFFQAVRLLQRLHPERRLVGRFEDPSSEVVRLGSNPSMAFPAGQIQDLIESPGGRWAMTVNFLGLVGHLGVLPDHYSVLVMRRVQSRDRALLDFLDMFHHRVLSLFYRAMERCRFYAPYERGEEDALTSRLMDLLGLADASARQALRIEIDELLAYVGLFGPDTRSAMALQQVIEDRFGVPAVVDQFVGGWYEVSSNAQCRVDDAGQSYSQQLGVGALVGDAIWDPQARARIILGPLSRERYDDFLPTGRAYEKLRNLTRFFSNDEVEFQLRLILEREETPPLRLGADDYTPLGWGSWIRSGSAPPETAETVLPL
jgi:type VI secretion system protein ImpH